MQSYRETEDTGDINAHAQPIVYYRFSNGPFAGRLVDNDENMRNQQVEVERRRQLVPGFQSFTKDHDVPNKFDGEGKVAVISSLCNVTPIYPPGTLPGVIKGYPPYSQWTTLVLEKLNDRWLLVCFQF